MSICLFRCLFLPVWSIPFLSLVVAGRPVTLTSRWPSNLKLARTKDRQRTWPCFSQVQPCLQPAGPRGRVHLAGSRWQPPPDCWPWGQSQPATARWWPAEKQPRSKTGPSGPGRSHKATIWIQSCHLSQQWDSQQSFKTASISTNSKSGQLVKVKHHLALLTSFPESFYHQPQPLWKLKTCRNRRDWCQALKSSVKQTKIRSEII